MSSRSTSQIAEGLIIGFSKKGHGLCFLEKPDGTKRTVEIPFAIPGDFVRFTLLRKRAGLCSARLEQILKASPERQAPRCVHFGICGGCRWQNLPYPEQLKIKQENVLKAFQSVADAASTLRQIIPCDPPWQYRNKMEFSFSSDAAKNHYLGLIIDSSRGKVLNLTECHLVNPWFVEALQAVREWWQQTGLDAYHPHSNSGSLRTLTLREGMRTGDRMAMLTVSGNPEYALQQKDLKNFTTKLLETIQPSRGELSLFLRIQQAIKGQETQFYEMLLHGPDHIREVLNIQLDPKKPPEQLTFSISPSAFFQPNTRQAEKLYSLALQMLNITKSSVVYDLYCGTGTLGICMAKKAKQVVSIEISPESSLDARANAAHNGIKNMTVLTGSVQDELKKIRSELELPLPDIVMVDPPRSGLSTETIRHLIELKPPTLLYISCNPLTQADNIAELIKAGYRLEAMQPVDQFPHTIHMENIAILHYNADKNENTS